MCSRCFENNRCKLKSIKNKTQQQQKLYDDYKKLYDIMRPGWDSDDY